MVGKGVFEEHQNVIKTLDRGSGQWTLFSPVSLTIDLSLNLVAFYPVVLQKQCWYFQYFFFHFFSILLNALFLTVKVFLKKICLFERERERASRGRGRGRGREADSPLSTGLRVGIHLKTLTLRSRPELKPRVRCLKLSHPGEPTVKVFRFCVRTIKTFNCNKCLANLLLLLHISFEHSKHSLL